MRFKVGDIVRASKYFKRVHKYSSWTKQDMVIDKIYPNGQIWFTAKECGEDEDSWFGEHALKLVKRPKRSNYENAMDNWGN